MGCTAAAAVQDYPSVHGPPTTIYNRFDRWRRKKLWPKIFETLVAQAALPADRSIDRTASKAHRSASGLRGAQAQAIGREQSGRTTKIRARTDGCGRPVRLALTPGTMADIRVAAMLIEAMPPSARLIAERLRRQPLPPAAGRTRHPGGHPQHRLPQGADPLRSHRRSQAHSDRAQVRPAHGLPPQRDPQRPAREKLPRCCRYRCNHHLVD